MSLSKPLLTPEQDRRDTLLRSLEDWTLRCAMLALIVVMALVGLSFLIRLFDRSCVFAVNCSELVGLGMRELQSDWAVLLLLPGTLLFRTLRRLIERWDPDSAGGSSAPKGQAEGTDEGPKPTAGGGA